MVTSNESETSQSTSSLRPLDCLHNLFAILDSEDWELLISHLDSEVQLADELTGAWLRGRDAVSGYLRAQRGVVTGIVSTPTDAVTLSIAENLWLVTFNMRQRYLLDTREVSERMTGACLIRFAEDGWVLVLYHLGSSGGPPLDAGASPNQDAKPADVANDVDADDATSILGSRIRAVRKARGLTLRELGERSRLSSGFLSQVERSQTDASVGSAMRIAAALGVSLSDLVELGPSSPPTRSALSRASERGRFDFDNVGVGTEVLQMPAGSRLRVHLLRYSANGRPHLLDGPTKSDTVYFVLDGTVDFIDSGAPVRLVKGDAISVEEGVACGVRLANDEAATVLVMSSGNALSG